MKIKHLKFTKNKVISYSLIVTDIKKHVVDPLENFLCSYIFQTLYKQASFIPGNCIELFELWVQGDSKNNRSKPIFFNSRTKNNISVFLP
jgi:hypothetical protein